MDEEPDNNGPDLMDAKRDLIKRGLKQGHLTRAQIASALPLEHMTDDELDLLDFTFQNMGIEVRGDEPQ